MSMFKYLIGFTALLVAGCAAFFSVKGIATLFSGAFIAALVMAGALEFGKLVAVSYLHREWNITSRLLKWYLSTAVVVLMFITSLGIFGFLSAAYQDSALKHEIHLSKIEAVEQRKSLVEGDMELLSNRIESLTKARDSQEQRLNEITSQIGKTMTARSAQALQESTQTLIEQSSTDIQTAQDKLDKLSDSRLKLDEEIMNIKVNNKESKDIQTFEFVAKEFNTELDTVAKWFILTIIFVFDPLAVALVLAYNSMVIRDSKRKIVVENLPDDSDDELSEPEKAEIEKKKQLMKLSHVKTKSGTVKDSKGNIVAET